MTFTQKVRLNLYREVRLLGHHAIMTRSATVFQRAFRPVVGQVECGGEILRWRRSPAFPIMGAW